MLGFGPRLTAAPLTTRLDPRLRSRRHGEAADLQHVEDRLVQQITAACLAASFVACLAALTTALTTALFAAFFAAPVEAVALAFDVAELLVAALDDLAGLPELLERLLGCGWWCDRHDQDSIALRFASRERSDRH